jgi:capsular polysaccharide biosynthesis protein
MLPPALSRLGYRLFSRSLPVASCATRTFQLGSVHHRISPPAIFAAADLDRITGVGIGTSRDRELQRVRGGEQLHGAVTAWELHDAILSGAFIYKRAVKHRVDGRAEQFLKPAPQIRLDEGVMSCTFYGGKYFGHSIRDDMPLTLLAASLGTPVRSSATLFEHQRDYLQMANLQATPHDSAYFDRLTVIDDHHQSRHRIERTREIRSRIRAAFPRPEHTGVFINRKSSGASRRLSNESEVQELFISRGFAVVDPGGMSTRDILSRVGGARIVAGVEGSHFAHGLVGCADDCSFLVLQPPGRFNNIYKDFTDAMDMRYAFLVGHPAPGDSFSVDTNALAGTLDHLQSLSAKSSQKA